MELKELLKLWGQAALNIWLELGRVVSQGGGASPAEFPLHM